MTLTYDEWLSMGLANGFIGPPVCTTHDGIPMTIDEEAEFEESDPCIFMVRPYVDETEKAAVEANHPPSVWRK